MTAEVSGDLLPDWLRAGIEGIRADREHGASYLAREAARLLARVADVEEPDVGRRLDLLRVSAQQLAATRPSMAAVVNTAARVWYAASCVEDGQDALRRADEEAARILRSWESACDAITGFALPLLGKSVFTLSRSGTVECVLRRLAERHAGKSSLAQAIAHVIVAESRPGGEGLALARALAESGAQVDLVPDAAYGVFIGEAATVVIGADTILADGSVVNKVGSYALAVVAREAGVPVYVLAETHKIAAAEFPAVFEALEWPGMPREPAPGVRARSVGFERAPAALIRAIITEEGVMQADEIGERAEEASRALDALQGRGQASL
jgi:translation initiation factor 2B subunit (eIF-2B alpha/beta/delta family)